MVSQSPASELDATQTDDMEDGAVQERAIAISDVGLPALSEGVYVVDGTEDILDLLDQDDLEGQAFALLDVRLQDKIVIIQDKPYIEYTMVVTKVQPVDLNDDGSIREAGAVFVMIAGRDNSVFGREMMAVWAARKSPTDSPVFPNGIRLKDLGNGQRYYTVRPERDPNVRVSREKLFRK